jgi:hypothetical protein
MNFLLELKHFDLNDLTRFSGRADYGRDWEPIDVAGELNTTSYRRGRSHRLTEYRCTFAERNSSCRVETTLKKSTSAQHRSKPKLVLIFAVEIFITSICSASAIDSHDQISGTLLRPREGLLEQKGI